METTSAGSSLSVTAVLPLHSCRAGDSFVHSDDSSGLASPVVSNALARRDLRDYRTTASDASPSDPATDGRSTGSFLSGTDPSLLDDSSADPLCMKVNRWI